MSDNEVRRCKGHDEPMYWHKDARKPAAGYWECAVKARQRKRERYRSDPVFRDKELERQRDYYHRADDGWLVKRRRELASQRARITEQLERLAEEAAAEVPIEVARD